MGQKPVELKPPSIKQASTNSHLDTADSSEMSQACVKQSSRNTGAILSLSYQSLSEKKFM